MFKYIENLRQKPDSTKKRIAFLVSFVFVAIIFVVWISVVFPDFQKEKQISDRISSAEPSPFSTFASIFSQGAGMIGEQFSKIKNASASIISGNFSDFISTSTTVIINQDSSTTPNPDISNTTFDSANSSPTVATSTSDISTSTSE